MIKRYFVVDIWLSQYHSIAFGVRAGWAFDLWSSFLGSLLSILFSEVILARIPYNTRSARP